MVEEVTETLTENSHITLSGVVAERSANFKTEETARYRLDTTDGRRIRFPNGTNTQVKPFLNQAVQVIYIPKSRDGHVIEKAMGELVALEAKPS